MRSNTVAVGLIVTLILAIGLIAACGGPTTPQATQPVQEEQPTVEPTEVPQEKEPTVEPTAPPQEEPTTEPTGGDGAVLLEQRCTTCHDLNRSTQAQKTREEWEQTVVRMVGKGAQLDEEEQVILIDYLAETYGP